MGGTVGARRPILVVDDDRSILETVTSILRGEGYEVTTATNGREALARIEQREPAVVLLDMRMPVLDGWGFAKALSAAGSRVPVVVMTAADNARKWSAEIGAEEFLAKPFDIGELIDLAERYAGSGRPN